jgi:hypothetical protein
VFLISLLLAPGKMDAEQKARYSAEVKSLTAERADMTAKLAALSEPRMTPLEKHHIDNATRAIATTGDPARQVLRHLHTHGRIEFGAYDPILPTGMTKDRTLELLRMLGKYDLVTETLNRTKTGIYSQFAISEGAREPLGKILFVTPSGTHN